MRIPALGVLLVVCTWLAPVRCTAAEWHWLWSRPKGQAQGGEVVFFRKAFQVDRPVKKAELFASCDNMLTLYLNGKLVVRSSEWQTPVRSDVGRHVRQGRNVVAVRGQNDGGNQAGLLVKLTLTLADGSKQEIATDTSWRIVGEEQEGWQTIALDDAPWTAAVSQGRFGTLPWGSLTGRTASRGAGEATPADAITLPPDFRIELIYTVPKATQGSWVAMAADGKGRLIVSDQGGAGLFRVTPPPIGKQDAQATVEKIDVPLSGAMGLVWAFDGLYVHQSGRGLFRVVDADGDDRFDTGERLLSGSGGGEHGLHAVTLSADGKSLLIDGGNHSNMPEGVDRGRFPGGWLPGGWQEDLLLPRQWDARGHARGRMAPGGWVCRMTPDGEHWDLLTIGYRNQYDVAVNRLGEMFTFDADMEWDMGMPWYRPTRICHATSGSNFGWRSGTGKWPDYYEDSLPATLDIGPGSPTGVLFGTGAKFPAKYQDALYALDWTFGTIYAVHLEPQGGSYTAVKEDFVFGVPLPVTDAVIGADGAFYFTIGGRNAQSALYRVTYTGRESTAPASGEGDPQAAAARKLRHRLEAFHGRQDPAALDTAWPYLRDPDRFIRYAARVAVASQPLQQWRSRALAERDPQAKVTAAVALAQVGPPELQGELLDSLLTLDFARLSESPRLGLLRAYALCFIRMGRPDTQRIGRIIARLDPHLPAAGDAAASDAVNLELVRLLVYLDAPGIVEKTLQLIDDARPQRVPDWAELIRRNGGYGGTIQRMLENHPPSQKIAYAFMLRNVRYGWSRAQRRTYFEFINRASKHTGGASYAGFLKNIRAEALKNCSEAEQAALASITGEDLDPPPPFEVTEAKGPGREWTVQHALAELDGGLHGRDFQSGRNLFYATKCAACHLFDGEGGDVGPDLSTVRNKFSHADLLESILEPSKVISDQYGAHVVLTQDGLTFEGLVVDTSGAEGGGDGDADGTLEIYLSDPDKPPVKLKKSDVDEMEPSKLSQMPEHLVDGLNAEELLDLLAYLLSRGNREAEMFQ